MVRINADLPIEIAADAVAKRSRPMRLRRTKTTLGMFRDKGVTKIHNDDAKEQIRQATDIVELISESIQLRRQGRNYVGRCIFHQDKSPSFTVNPQRQTWKCWPCNRGGDIFEFVKQRDKVDFPAALRILADRAGIELKRQAVPRAQPGTSGDKATLFEVLSWAEKLFHENLLTSDSAEPARRYLDERGINDESVERYRVGYAPQSWNWLSDQSRWSRDVLEATGLVIAKEGSSGIYDRYRGRVMFPIRDTQNRTIAFGGRILPELADEKSAKYINSPETRVYSKRDNLYGFDVVMDHVRMNRRVLVMEGYTDVVMARQYGQPDCVAVLGTALGSAHVNLLSRFADQIVLVLDGDDAGQRSTNDVLELFIERQVDLRIVTLPTGSDPCDFIQERGREEFEALIASAPDALEHKLQSTIGGFDPKRDTHRATAALEEILTTLAKAPRSESAASPIRLRQQQVLRRLSREFDMPENDLRQRIGELRRAKPRHTTTDDENPIAERPTMLAWERELLEFLTQYPDSIALVAESIGSDDLETEAARLIFDLYLRADEEGRSTDFSSLLSSVDDSQTKNLLVELDETVTQKSVESRDQWLGELMDSFRQRRADRESHQRKLKIDNEQLDSQTKLSLLEQIIQEKRSRQGISAPTDG